MKLISLSPQTVEKCCQEIIAANAPRPLLVGITGEACAGKNHFSALLVERFQASFVYFSSDDFLISRQDREKLRAKTFADGEFAGRQQWEVLETWYRLNEFDAAIKALKAGEAFTLFPYERSTGRVSTTAATLTPAPYVLIDTGMFLEKMDFLLLVTADPAVILERKRQRGVYRSWDEIVEIAGRVQAFHWNRVKPPHADIEITNND